MNPLVSLTRDGDVAIITINNPPVNALSPGVPEGIAEAIREIAQDDAVKSAVLIGGGRTFIAGADIREFGKITGGAKKAEIGLTDFLIEMEDCPKPIVCAIHGTAFGGGRETAMGAHYRVAVESAQVGQPEVKLGLIPGAHGTQRLPRLAGVEKALAMCWNGDPVKAKDAQACGIVDRIVEGDLLAGAVAFAREFAGKPARKTRERNEKLQADDAVFAAAREAASKKMRGVMAPQKAIDAVEAAVKRPWAEGIGIEGKLFQECLFSDQSKALIHVFFGEREVAKIPDVPADTPVIPVTSIAVIGAGTMGGGIAMVFANAGIPVLLKETEQAALDRGMATIRKNYANSVAKGRFTQAAMDERMARITPQLGWDGFDQVDMVIEAVFEGMALKKEIFGHLDKICKPTAILASNTSTLSIDEIASATSRPEMVIGTHFFSPANVMRLLEIVRGEKTSKEVIQTCMQLSKKVGKIGVLVGNCRGFVGNRMFHPYRREAQFMAEEGAPVEAIDKAMYKFGMAMGPLATGDLAGLDVGWRIRKEFKHTELPDVRYPKAEDALCEMGRFGQKTKAGWYKYDENRKASPDPVVAEVLQKVAAENPIPQHAIDEQEIVDRLLYALVNEGARILEEGLALRSVDIDIIYLNGYGFPAHRGGPMFYADLVGLDTVYARICEFEKQHGYWWRPAPLLKKLAEEGGAFGKWRRS
ncbi:MAG: 3-hydroxyacyl-CoA dehydrogenase NAD-binding domain-containing protein [Bryobacteraceae bacterium]